MIGKWLYRIGIAVLCGVILFSGYKLISDKMDKDRAAREYEELARMAGAATAEASPEPVSQPSPSPQAAPTQAPKAQDESQEPTPEPEPAQYPILDLDLAALKEKNPDFRGWLYFPAVDISYPVVQGSDNDYYLNHTFEGTESHSGCIILDCGASPDWSDRNTFVFGHNMKDGSMFGRMKKLLSDSSVLKTYPYFYIYTDQYVYTYEVFAFYNVDAYSDRYMTFTTDGTYDTYVEWAKEDSEYESTADFTDRGNIVSLSTCHGSVGGSTRLLLHGVQCRAEVYPPILPEEEETE